MIVSRSLEEISTSYCIFEKDQVLTHDQLNSLVDYCTDETRLTRVKLLGVGVACGLRVSFVDNRVTVTKGAGVTTDGDLVWFETDTVFDKYKPYDLEPPAYGPFYVGGNGIPLYELVAQGRSDDRIPALAQFKPNTQTELADMTAVLFVESYVHDEDICTATDCDNLGKNSINQVRLLLTDKSSIHSLQSTVTSAAEASASLNRIVADRPLLTPNITTVGQLERMYRSACDSIYEKLIAEIPRLYPGCSFFLGDIFTSDPAAGWVGKLKIHNTAFTSSHVGIQYYYDFLKDAVETWNSFYELLFGDRTWCCPDVTRFPKHLLLGDLAPGANPEANRTPFYPSPITSQTSDRLNHAKFLAKKLDLLIQTFEIPGVGAIRVTPSRFEEASLEKRAIPYYYSVNGILPIHKNWSFQLSQQGMDSHIYSYHAADYGAQGPAANPLGSQIGSFSFFRIEGHLGQNVATARSAIENEINSKNLPLAVQAVMLGEDKTKVVKKPPLLNTDLHRLHYILRKDLADQLDDVIEAGESFTKQVNTLTSDQVENLALIKNTTEQKRSTIELRGQIARDGLKSQTYSEYKASPAWKGAVFDTKNAAAQLKYDLGEVAKVDFPTPLDSLIGSVRPHLLDWLDIIIQDKEDKRDEKLLFAKFQTEHPGLEHFAGVLRGGTFVLVYDTGNKIVADFMLPYFCGDATEEETEEPPLPKPAIKIPSIPDHGIKVRPSLDKYIKGKLNVMEVDLDTKWKSKFDLQQDLFRNSISVVGTVLGSRGPTLETLPGGKYNDGYLGLKVRETQNKRELINYLNIQANDPRLAPDVREGFAGQAKDAQVELAKSIQETTTYIDRSGVNVAAGTEGHSAIQEVATSVAVLTDTAAVDGLKAGLTDVQGRTTNVGLKTEIGNVLVRFR